MNIFSLITALKVGFGSTPHNALMAVGCEIVLKNQSQVANKSIVPEDYDLFIALEENLFSPGEFVDLYKEISTEYKKRIDEGQKTTTDSVKEIYKDMNDFLALCLKTPSRMTFIPLEEISSISFSRMRTD